MATVYEAGHTVLQRRAALKVMHGSLRRLPGMATRVVQEAEILDSVRHPGVVRVFDCNVLPDRRPWIAMELVEGETLANRLQEVTALPPIEVAALLGDVSDVLASVHKTGVVHRDLKPDNLLCTPTDLDYPIRVLDWGVARMGPIGRLTIDGLTPGTPVYMSPEQATGRDIAPACDIYSLGVIAYEALTGRPPFDGQTLAEVVYMHLSRAPAPLRARCNAPVELCDLVARMLHKIPEMRPSSLEVRHTARAIARELSHGYDAYEVVTCDDARDAVDEIVIDVASGAVSAVPQVVDRDDVIVIDVEELERGVTELLPVVRQPRWTPEIGRVPDLLADPTRRSTVAPRTSRDQVAGEFLATDKAR
jgi:serine/threonine-protein kinase